MWKHRFDQDLVNIYKLHLNIAGIWSIIKKDIFGILSEQEATPVKDIGLLVWLTQLGLSVALPPAGFILLAVWLQDRFSLGNWVLWTGVVLGVICAINGLRSSLKAMGWMTKDKQPKDTPVSFNDHE